MRIGRVLTGATLLGVMTSAVVAPVAFAADVTPSTQVTSASAAPSTTESSKPAVSTATETRKPSVSTPAPSTSAADGTPKGAPQTGGGGTADDGSGNIGLIALGGAVVVGGAGLGVWAIRRRAAQG